MMLEPFGSCCCKQPVGTVELRAVDVVAAVLDMDQVVETQQLEETLIVLVPEEEEVLVDKVHQHMYYPQPWFLNTLF